MKDIKFVSFTDTIDIIGVQYHSAVMVDGSSFIFNGVGARQRSSPSDMA